MKRTNIEIGDYVIHKQLGSIVKAVDEMSVAGALASGEDNPIGGVIVRSSLPEMVGHHLKHGIIAKLYRRPTIEGLSPGDRFEWEDKQGKIRVYVFLSHMSKEDVYVKVADSSRTGVIFVTPNTKIKIISLASEKVETKAKRDALGDLKDAERMVPIEPTPVISETSGVADIVPSAKDIVAAREIVESALFKSTPNRLIAQALANACAGERERIAKHIDNEVSGYVDEVGIYDYETGQTEFSNAGEEYIGTLEDLSDQIRNLPPEGE